MGCRRAARASDSASPPCSPAIRWAIRAGTDAVSPGSAHDDLAEGVRTQTGLRPAAALRDSPDLPVRRAAHSFGAHLMNEVLRCRTLERPVEGADGRCRSRSGCDPGRRADAAGGRASRRPPRAWRGCTDGRSTPDSSWMSSSRHGPERGTVSASERRPHARPQPPSRKPNLASLHEVRTRGARGSIARAPRRWNLPPYCSLCDQAVGALDSFFITSPKICSISGSGRPTPPPATQPPSTTRFAPVT